METKPPISDDRWRLVERVADSSLFQKPSRLRDLFLHICDCSLQGRNEELREQRIGEVVFGRGDDFRPSDDSIVRVEARILRKRLEEYFATEGKGEPIIIAIPKGAYIAMFVPRTPLEALLGGKDVAQGHAELVEFPVATAPDPKLKHTSKFSWTAFFFFTTLVSLAFAGWLLISDHRYPYRPTSQTQAPAQSQPLWADLFDRNHETFIVCADSALVLGEEITQSQVLLSDYVNRKYWPLPTKSTAGFESVLETLRQRQYTSITDVRLVQQILEANHDFRDRASVRSARNVQLVDFKSGNFVLIGSRFSNPWVQLFEPSLNFRFRFDFRTKRTGFENVNPKPGERRENWVEGDLLQAEQTYCVIAFVPNLSRNGNVLMIAGATREGTEAAGEYITNPRLTLQMLKSIHALDNGHVRYFEVLLKSGTIAGTSKNADVVAYRLLS